MSDIHLRAAGLLCFAALLLRAQAPVPDVSTPVVTAPRDRLVVEAWSDLRPDDLQGRLDSKAAGNLQLISIVGKEPRSAFFVFAPARKRPQYLLDPTDGDLTGEVLMDHIARHAGRQFVGGLRMSAGSWLLVFR